MGMQRQRQRAATARRSTGEVRRRLARWAMQQCCTAAACGLCSAHSAVRAVSGAPNLLCCGRCAGAPTQSRCRRCCRSAGKLHFVKFETAKVHECVAFIEAKGAAGANGGWGQGGARLLCCCLLAAAGVQGAAAKPPDSCCCSPCFGAHTLLVLPAAAAVQGCTSAATAAAARCGSRPPAAAPTSLQRCGAGTTAVLT